MARIVVIEDDRDLLALLKYNLEKAGFEVDGCESGASALAQCSKSHPGLVLLDIMLPGCDGLEILKGIRSNAHLAHVPVILLTARASEADRILGLELGASDYIVKPFFMRELIARVKLQFRQQAIPARVLEAGGVVLDRGTCEVRAGGRLVSLTATEFRLLEFLMSRPGVVFSRDQLLDGVWGQGRAVTDRAVDVYILRLRQKLGVNSSEPQLLQSVRGFGYTFRPPRSEQQAAAAG